MSRLRNRMVKAEFWTDPELLRWPLAKRVFYQGLWALAEDSGCLEDDPFVWKLQLFPSPLDADVGIDTLSKWRGELVKAGKLIAYKANGKPHLYIRTFHQHEHPRNPQRPMLPMPKWLLCDSVRGVGKDGRGWVRTQYTDPKHPVPDVNETCTSPAQDAPPRPAPSRVPKGTSGKGRGDKSPAPPLSEERPDPVCPYCSKRLGAKELADESAVAGDGFKFWHVSCVNGNGEKRDAALDTATTRNPGSRVGTTLAPEFAGAMVKADPVEEAS